MSFFTSSSVEQIRNRRGVLIGRDLRVNGLEVLVKGHIAGCVKTLHVFGQQRHRDVGLGVAEPSAHLSPSVGAVPVAVDGHNGCCGRTVARSAVGGLPVRTAAASAIFRRQGQKFVSRFVPPEGRKDFFVTFINISRLKPRLKLKNGGFPSDFGVLQPSLSNLALQFAERNPSVIHTDIHTLV